MKNIASYSNLALHILSKKNWEFFINFGAKNIVNNNFRTLYAVGSFEMT